MTHQVGHKGPLHMGLHRGEVGLHLRGHCWELEPVGLAVSDIDNAELLHGDKRRTR